MLSLLSNLKIAVPENIYIKDPESSELGKRIVEHSILLIADIGFESFTFKKLGEKINSNESSIYRYFESKHKILVYLTSWYWAWVEYQLVFATQNIGDDKEKLTKAIEIIARNVQNDRTFLHIDEVCLNKIIINESQKSYLTTYVDAENKEGYFKIYKGVVSRISQMILKVNPKYKYPSSLASTITESALHQHFLKDHFKSITDCDDSVSPSDFLVQLTLNAIK